MRGFGWRGFGRRHRTAIAVAGTLATAALLVLALAGKRDEFETAIRDAPLGIIALTVALQVLALVSRSEAWHLTIQAAGGRVPRRGLYPASRMQGVRSGLHTQLGVGARGTPMR